MKKARGASRVGSGTEVTGCAVTVPSCANLKADPASPACGAYAAALASSCAPGGRQNYDSASCVAALQRAPVDPATGSVSAATARAFFTACYDCCYFLFTAGGFALDGTTGALGSWGYLVKGNAKLAQTGGYRIVWLGG